MRLITMTFIVLAVAALAGFGSAYWALHGSPPLGAVRVGPWTSWPNLGAKTIDPYARGIVARSGALPLGSGEGHVFIAAKDDAGAPLSAGCSYQVEGDMPPARIWTLTLSTPQGEPITDPAGDTTLTAADVLRDGQGRAGITLSRTPAPGNWMRLPASGPMQLVLRLYDSPVSISSRTLETRALPGIRKIGCP